MAGILPVIGTELQGWADELTEAGMNAAIDPRDLNLPAVWIIPQQFTFNRLNGTTCDAELALVLLTADTADAATSWDDLGAMLDQLSTIVPGASQGDIRPVTVQLPSISPDPINALQVTVTVEIG